MSNSGNVKDAPPDYLLKVDQPLVVPAGKKVRIITTANDVIHSFMVPAFGIKQDAIPGFVRDTWFKAEKPATTTASAPSCAARNTPTCPSM
jgi:cytochrome c oxidase subunit 2